MSDWQVGDLALCVDAKPRKDSQGDWSTIQEGRIYRVIHLTPRAHGYNLGLSGVNEGWPTHGLNPSRFRKILPDKHEACEDEFAILLKLSKQRVKA